MKKVILFALAALLAAAPGALACVGCREPGAMTLASENPTVMAGMGFSWSVIFLLGFVLSLLAAMVSYIVSTCRRLDRERAGQ